MSPPGFKLESLEAVANLLTNKATGPPLMLFFTKNWLFLNAIFIYAKGLILVKLNWITPRAEIQKHRCLDLCQTWWKGRGKCHPPAIYTLFIWLYSHILIILHKYIIPHTPLTFIYSSLQSCSTHSKSCQVVRLFHLSIRVYTYLPYFKVKKCVGCFYYKNYPWKSKWRASHKP